MSSLWGSDPHNVVCAVSEARGVSPSVGLAFVNLSTSEATLSQICDSQFYVKTVHKIQMHEPSYILVISTSFNPKSNLLSILEEELAGTHIHPVDRKYWAETAGLQFVQTLGFREDVEATKVAMQGNFFATCAFAAVSNAAESVPGHAAGLTAITCRPLASFKIHAPSPSRRTLFESRTNPPRTQ